MAKSNAAQERLGKSPFITGVRIACVCAGLLMTAAIAHAAEAGTPRTRMVETARPPAQPVRTGAAVASAVGAREPSDLWALDDAKAAAYRMSQEAIRRIAPLVAQTIKASPAIF